MLLAALLSNAQNQQIPVGLYSQFNGRYDFTFVGNTLNEYPNGTQIIQGTDTIPSPCTILTTSSANFQLTSGSTVKNAYLYWAGSGAGDFQVKLNGQNVSAQRTFPVVFDSPNVNDPYIRPFFSAFADVTSIVQELGSGIYTLSDLDLTNVIFPYTEESPNIYCFNATNFGGWAMVVIYQNSSLPLNQINVYDGLQFVPDELNITLSSINVIDNIGAKIGFVAWEGDRFLADGEVLRINGSILANSINPPSNAFNGTNTVTGSTQLYNMDLDIYNIQNYIQPGDETAEIKLRSNADFVMINAVVTLLNSELPDATVDVTNVQTACNSREITVNYRVRNINSTAALPAGTPIAIYLGGVLTGTAQTTNVIPIGGSENTTITLTIPAGAGNNFQLKFVVDDPGDGSGGIVQETDETNNTFIINVVLPASPPLTQPADVTVCDEGNGAAIFDFSGYETSLRNEPTDTVTFYLTQELAESGTGNITNPESFTSTSSPQQIFVRLENEDGCFSIASFNLLVVDCLLPDATIVIGESQKECNSRVITVAYTVNNFNSQDILPSGTPIAIYANGEFIEFTETILPIPIGGSESGIITLTIPAATPLDFELSFVADDSGNGTGIVTESDENNNITSISFSLIVSPELLHPLDVFSCNEGFGFGTFDFSAYEEQLKNNASDVVTFYATLANAQQDTDPIFNTSSYTTTVNPQEIFVRLFDGNCFTIGSFFLRTKKCPPETYSYVTPNGDGKNDTFFVKGLRNIFPNFKISIYNRWGSLVWTGDHSKDDWNGVANVEKVGTEGTTVPVGTYYFVLELNDAEFPEPIVGWVYVTE